MSGSTTKIKLFFMCVFPKDGAAFLGWIEWMPIIFGFNKSDSKIGKLAHLSGDSYIIIFLTQK